MRYHTVRYHKMYTPLLCYVAFLFAVGLALDDLHNILPGLKTILLSTGMLITDYIELAGPGAAFFNSAIVTLFSVAILYFGKVPLNGYTIVEMGLMSGFALFGKNFVNMWPIIAGTVLYAKVQREPFCTYASVSLMSTSLAPMVSFIFLGGKWWSIPVSILVGMLIGFVLPPLSAYTYKIQNGMNLYNMGFACGLLALVLTPVMYALGADVTINNQWATGYNLPLSIMLSGLCVVFILSGLFLCHRPIWAAWAGYRRLLQTTGRTPSDYLRMLGSSAVLINMGVNGLIAMALLLFAGGDLNGPTVGGIFTIIGFSAFGKHARNITPIILGVILGGIVLHQDLSVGGVQLAMLFGTTMAPIAGCFGWPVGMLAGFLHSAVVLRTGLTVSGFNLYNNGFSGGLLTIVFYPVVMAALRHRNPELQDVDFFEDLDEDSPTIPPPREEK